MIFQAPEQWAIWVGPAQQAVSGNLCNPAPCRSVNISGQPRSMPDVVDVHDDDNDDHLAGDINDNKGRLFIPNWMNFRRKKTLKRPLDQM